MLTDKEKKELGALYAKWEEEGETWGEQEYWDEVEANAFPCDQEGWRRARKFFELVAAVRRVEMLRGELF